MRFSSSVLFALAASAAVACHAYRSQPITTLKRVRSRQRRRLRKLVKAWRKELWHSVVPFWLNNAVDEECGGFFTCLGRQGEVIDQTKFHWLQGRAVWTCSRLCRKLLGGEMPEHRSDISPGEAKRLLLAAHNGALFLKNAKDRGHGDLGDGGSPIYFSTTRDGWPLHIQRKPYTAVFYVFACLEYSELLLKFGDLAAKTFQCERSEINSAQAYFRQEALEAFDFVCKCIDDPTVCGRLPPKPASRSRRDSSVAIDIETGETVPIGNDGEELANDGEVASRSSLAEVMCLSALSEELLRAVPEQKSRWDAYVDDSMRRVVKHFCPTFKVFMEEAHAVHGVQHATPGGRMFNPGHSIEVAWFLLHLCRLKDERNGEGASAEHQRMALIVLEHSLELGWDTAGGGGITYMMDILGKPLQDCTVTAEHKLWWPLCEALYALTLAFTLTREEKWLVWLERVHKYIVEHLSDYADLRDGQQQPNHGGGEWFGYLRPDGTVFNECKGGNYKGFFHVPRALLYSAECAEAFLKSESCL